MILKLIIKKTRLISTFSSPKVKQSSPLPPPMRLKDEKRDKNDYIMIVAVVETTVEVKFFYSSV